MLLIANTLLSLKRELLNTENEEQANFAASELRCIEKRGPRHSLPNGVPSHASIKRQEDF